MKILYKYFLLVIFIFVFENLQSQTHTWDRRFDYLSTFYRAIETSDGGFIATGEKLIFTPSNNWKFYTVKVNSSGDTLWSSLFNTQNMFGYTAYWIEQTNDHGYVITGQGAFQAHLVKIDSAGQTMWFKSYGIGENNRGVFVKQTPDLGYALLVYTYSPSNILFVKTDSLGNLEWQKLYDSGGEDYPVGFNKMGDDGYLIVSTSSITNPSYLHYLYLLRVKENGDTLWTKKIDYSTRRISYNSIDKTFNNEIIVGGGNAIPFDSTLVIKMDTSGNIDWKRKYSSFEWEFCNSIADVPGRGIIVAGGGGNKYPDEKGMLRLLDYEGNIIFEKFYVYPGAGYNFFKSVSPSSDNGFIISGYVYVGVNSNEQAYLLKTDSLGNLVDIQSNFEIVNDYELYQNYPNPFNPSTTISYYLPAAGNIKLVIYDALGRETAILVNKRQYAGKHEVTWNASNFSSGIYYYSLIAGNFSSTKKLVLLK